MGDKIIPLRPKGDEASALARFDILAAELLAEGRAATLSAARINVVVTEIREQRAKLALVLEDLQTRSPTGNAQIDKANADLRASASEGITNIDMLIRAIEASHLEHPAEDQPA